MVLLSVSNRHGSASEHTMPSDYPLYLYSMRGENAQAPQIYVPLLPFGSGASRARIYTSTNKSLSWTTLLTTWYSLRSQSTLLLQNGGYFLVFRRFDLKDDRFGRSTPNIGWRPRSWEQHPAKVQQLANFVKLCICVTLPDVVRLGSRIQHIFFPRARVSTYIRGALAEAFIFQVKTTESQDVVLVLKKERTSWSSRISCLTL